MCIFTKGVLLTNVVCASSSKKCTQPSWRTPKKGANKPMDVILKQSENRVGLYVDKKLATVFNNKNVEQVTEWVTNNFKNVKIHITK